MIHNGVVLILPCFEAFIFCSGRLSDGGLLVSHDGNGCTTYMKEEVDGYANFVIEINDCDWRDFDKVLILKAAVHFALSELNCC